MACKPAFVNNQTNQIVIVFRGPASVPAVGEVLLHNGATTSDGMIMDGDVSGLKGLQAAVSQFITAVKNQALSQKPPISTDTGNIFVAGSSLGGYEAEWAASQNGFGGASFGGPGMPGYTAPQNKAMNFTNYILSGDPVGNYASDTGIDFPIAMSNLGSHYGQVTLIGSSTGQDILKSDLDEVLAPGSSSVGIFADPADEIVSGAVGLLADVARFHLFSDYVAAFGGLPSVQADDLPEDPFVPVLGWSLFFDPTGVPDSTGLVFVPQSEIDGNTLDPSGSYTYVFDVPKAGAGQAQVRAEVSTTNGNNLIDGIGPADITLGTGIDTIFHTGSGSVITAGPNGNHTLYVSQDQLSFDTGSAAAVSLRGTGFVLDNQTNNITSATPVVVVSGNGESADGSQDNGIQIAAGNSDTLTNGSQQQIALPSPSPVTGSCMARC
jgi:hypothetical protein